LSKFQAGTSKNERLGQTISNNNIKSSKLINSILIRNDIPGPNFKSVHQKQEEGALVSKMPKKLN
jgi:hypothetical protein